MRRGIVCLALLIGLVGAAPAYSAIEVAITSPAGGAHSLSGVVPVLVTASADNGIYAVQLNVDGAAYGAPDTEQVGQYRYEIDWNTSGLPAGDHTLTVTAYDWSLPFPQGGTQTSTPIVVDLGPAYPTISLVTPQPWTFVRGQVALTESHTSAVDPSTVSFTVDGSPVPASWNSATVPDGSHTIAASIVDGRGKQATASATVTVDNTPPTTYVQSPAPNQSFTGSMPVAAHASDAYGISSVQFTIDGAPVGAAVTSPSSPYSYTATLSLAGLANGVHQLRSVATNQAGGVTTSAPVAFSIGVSALTVAVSAPPDWSYFTKTSALTATPGGGTGPYSVQFLANGTAVGAPVTSSPYTLPGSAVTLADGAYTVSARVTDANGLTATSTAIHVTVDNTAPSAVMYQPAPNSIATGAINLQVHASDANGVQSVRFTVDGNPVGALRTAPDSGQLYLYTISYDTTPLAAGTHAVAAIVIDRAGNTTTAASVSITTGPVTYVPVLNYHGLTGPLDTSPDIYDQTPAEADAQLSYLKTNGYQSITLEQYQTWVGTHTLPAGVSKPVLITVDDGLTDQLAWDPLLQKYGFKAVLFVITGYVDNTTPGDADPGGNMTWAQIQSLAGNGRWQIGFHAGQYGHGDSYSTGAKIGTMSYTKACPYFYSCLGRTVTGRTTTPETPAALEAAVANEVTNGVAELKANVPSASLVAWALPFNDAGQWTNLYNDASGAVQSWLPGFMNSKFPIIFTQTNPVTYAQASGTVGSLSGFGRRYRFEVHTDTTLAQFSAALVDPAFAN